MFIMGYMGIENTFITFLKKERKARKLSQPAFADFLGIPFETYKSYEYGKNAIKLDVVERIAERLDVDPSDMLMTDKMLDPGEILKDPNFEALERIAKSFGYDIDVTNWSDYTDSEKEQIIKIDMDIANVNSWERAIDVLEDHGALWWFESLTKVKNSPFALYRFLFFFEMFHPKRSMIPAQPGFGFPEDYPQWVMAFDLGFVKRNFFFSKDFIRSHREDMNNNRVKRWHSDALIELKNNIKTELEERAIKAEKDRISGKTTA